MDVICIGRNATAVDNLQVPIKYTFELAVRNVRGQIASMFFKWVHMFLKLIEIANILYYDISIIEPIKRLMVKEQSHISV